MERFRASSAYTFAALIEKVASSMGKEREAGRGDGAPAVERAVQRAAFGRVRVGDLRVVRPVNRLTHLDLPQLTRRVRRLQ